MDTLKDYLTALCTLVLVTTAAFGQTFNNIVVDGSPGDRSETSIAVDPNNPQHLMATWNEYGAAISSNGEMGWAFSTDGGTDWSTEGTITPSEGYGFDPSCAIGRNHNEYYSFVNWSGSQPYGPVDLAVSTNNGQSWNTIKASYYDTYHDKPYLTVDTTTSPYAGNVYVVYRSSYLYRKDGGIYTYIKLATLPKGDVNSNWVYTTIATSATIPPLGNSPTSNDYVNFASPAVGPHGTLYVAYYVGTLNSAGVPQSNEAAEICVAKSTNGGSNFELMKTFSITGAYQQTFGYIRVSSIPTMVVDPTNSNVYLAFVEGGSSYHIYFTRSTDGGSSWSTPTIVTQDTTGDQVFPWLTVNATGIVSLVYYEVDNGSVDVYSAQSFNHGQSFAGQNGAGEDVKLTSASGNTNFSGSDGGYSDYLGVASDGLGDVHALRTQFTSTTSQEIECANYSQRPEVTPTGPNYIDAGGSGAYYLINGNQTSQLAWDLGTPVPIQVVPQNSNWAFAGWNSGSYQNPSNVYAGGVVEPSANLKELQHSMDVSADSDNSQRKFIRVNATGYLFQTYDDNGHAWLEYSTNGGSAWNLANYGEPLDYDFTNGTSPGSKGPSLSYYDQNGYDVVAAAIEEPNSSGHYSIYLDVFYYSNGSYQPFGPQWIDDEPDSTYFADANPNVVLNGPENNSLAVHRAFLKCDYELQLAVVLWTI